MEDKILKLLEENAKDGYNEMTEVIPIHEFERIAKEIVKLFTIPDVIKPLPPVENGEKLEYCCLGFPNDWYDIPEGITNMKYFEPLRIRKRKPNGEIEIVYDTTKKGNVL